MKYIELFKDCFDSTVSEKIKPENYPYVGYCSSEGLRFTVVPKLQPNNEIWYTTSDGNVITPNMTNGFGSNIIGNSYEDGKGVITFDGDVTSIGDYAFSNCSKLTSITIPKTITYIGDGAVNKCSILDVITFTGTKSEWNAINKHDNWKAYTPGMLEIRCTDGVIY